VPVDKGLWNLGD
jgi:putative transposase